MKEVTEAMKDEGQKEHAQETARRMLADLTAEDIVALADNAQHQEYVVGEESKPIFTRLREKS